MDYSITPEDREKLRQIKEQKFPDDQTTEPEYKLVEGYKHLEVLKSGHLYSLEYRGKSVRIGCNRVNRAGIASFIQDYLETRDVDEAHRRNYSSKSKRSNSFCLF